MPANSILCRFVVDGHSYPFEVVSHCGFDLHFFSCDVAQVSEADIKCKIITRSGQLPNQNQDLETPAHTAIFDLIAYIKMKSNQIFSIFEHFNTSNCTTVENFFVVERV